MRHLWYWLDFLFPPREDEITLRDVSIDDFLSLMNPVLVPETRPSTVALFPFHARQVRAAIHEAKYHGNEHAFCLLAAALTDYLRDADEGFRKSIIVPVPLGRERQKERGFNQIHEVLLRVLRSLGEEGVSNFALESDLLIRIRETASQVGLPREKREKNMREAFQTTRSANSSHTYIVVDDVITTGATLQAAIDALREAGAEHIIPLALAH